MNPAPYDTHGSLSFWSTSQVVDIGGAIPLLVGKAGVSVGRFPGTPPPIEELFNELQDNETCWLAVDNRRADHQPGDTSQHFRLLAGRLLLHIGYSLSEGRPRLYLQKRGGVEFATNRLRATLLSQGRLLRHRGIYCLTGAEYGVLEREGDEDGLPSFWSSGVVPKRVRDAVFLAREEQAELEAPKRTLSEPELTVLGTLREYVDAQFELEQRAARELPGFVYTGLRAEAREHVYRRFLRVQLDPPSAERLRAEGLRRLSLETGDGNGLPLDVQGEVEADGSIVVSVQGQLDSTSLPRSGVLLRSAPPTTHRICTSVLDSLEKGAHGWLASVAAGNHATPPFSVQPLERAGKLNPSQAYAVASGNQTPDYMLVLGPPGTGKTTVIADWVKYFVEEKHQRVLIASLANKAVDNVLERLSRDGGIECVRLANESKVLGSVQHLLIEKKAPAMQQALIDHGSANVARLGAIRDWLLLLRAHLPEYTALQRTIWNLDAERSKVEQGLTQQAMSLQASSSELTRARDRELGTAEKVRDLTHRRSTAPTHVLARLIHVVFLRLYLQLSLFFARRRLASLLTTREALERELASAQASSTELRRAQERVSTELALAQARRDTIAPNPPPLAPQLGITAEALPSDLSTAQRQLEEQLARVERLAATVASFRESMANERQDGLLPLLLSMVDVVGATCIGISSKPEFRSTPFDVVIVDESGQIQLHNLMVPLSRAPKAILVGDHKQLPPVVQPSLLAELEARNTPQDFLNQSWFEKLWNEAPPSRKAVLDTQFRCPQVISDYISTEFYESKYYAGPGTADKRPLLAQATSCLLFIDTSEHPNRGELTERAEGVGSAEGSHSVFLDNPLETRLVMSVLASALASWPQLFDDPEGLGVIVPYKNHVARIQQRLREEIRLGTFPAPATPINDLVATVDSFQGQERRLIICPMGRANGRGAVGFLQDARRLNVAMTRAKEQLVLIADAYTMTSHYDERSEDADFKRKMRSLVKYAERKAQLVSAVDWLDRVPRRRAS